MRFVYVKDSEGYVSKKATDNVGADEIIITEKEYLKKSGLGFCKKVFSHGGTRENAGRKQKFSKPLKYQMRVTEDEKEFIQYAREQKISYASLMDKK